jgi:hypothetical protein
MIFLNALNRKRVEAKKNRDSLKSLTRAELMGARRNQVLRDYALIRGNHHWGL